MEILAPVGGEKQLRAAIAAKADAIYLGSDRFSARAGAENFSLDDIGDVCLRCHHEGIKVYLAVNTLFKEDEITSALNTCVDFINEGVDAVIIQDFGLLLLLEKHYKEIEKHSSTQMSIHNLAGAKYISKKGISRVVLARELSIEEIREISAAGIETEVFVHGAICISYSGQCLFSSLNGGRSANRGRCAQPCRKPYKLMKSGKEIDSGYLISPRDRSYINDMKKLSDIGVNSFKIEGRLRNENYVFETITQYKNALKNRQYSIEKLGQIFKRGEFSNTYLESMPSSDFITKSGGSNIGLLLGRIKNGKITLKTDLELGDGVKSGKDGFIVTKIMMDNRKLKIAKAGDTISLFPTKYKEGDILYKTASQRQKKSIEASIASYSPTPITVNVCVNFEVGKPIKLYNEDNEVYGKIVEKAIKSPISSNKIINNIEKSSSKFISLKVVENHIEDGFMKLSEINLLRRNFIKILEDKYIKKSSCIKKKQVVSKQNTKKSSEDINLVIISKKQQLTAFDYDVTVCINPFSMHTDGISIDNLKDIDCLGKEYYIKVPTIVRRELNEIISLLKSLKNLKGVVTANLGIISVLEDDMKIIGYYDLNVMNSFAVDFFDKLDYIIPSPELSKTELSMIENKAKLLPLIYGNIKYMNMEYSPIGNYEQNADSYYLEENGHRALIEIDVFGRTTLRSYQPLNHSYRLEEYNKSGYTSYAIELGISDENPDVILNNFVNLTGFGEENLINYLSPIK